MSEPELVRYFVLLTAGAHLAYDICLGHLAYGHARGVLAAGENDVTGLRNSKLLDLGIKL